MLATIGRTVPAVLAIGLASGKTLTLRLDPKDLTMLLVTLAVSLLTFSARRTHVLQGLVHLVLLLAYLMLIFAS